MHTDTPRFGQNHTRSRPRRDSRTDLLGTKLDSGRYELLDRLGAGGVGVVYRGRQAPLGREVAIKLLRGHHAASAEGVAAFWREARAAALIDHVNVVRLIDFGHDDREDFFIVMELLEGTRLDDMLAETPIPEVAWTCHIMAQVLAGIAAAHDQGVVHQDVKPANVLVRSSINSDGKSEMVVKLCDFGLAALLKVAAGEGGVVDGRRGLCGTPAYMSPEQVRCEPATSSTDIYACGVMLYEMAVGQLPFRGDSAMAVAMQRLRAPVVPPSEHNPDLDPELEQVILRALAVDRADRYRSARQMRADLLLIMRRALADRPREGGDDEDTRPFLALHELGRSRGDDPVRQDSPGSWRDTALALGVGVITTATIALLMWWLLHGARGPGL